MIESHEGSHSEGLGRFGRYVVSFVAALFIMSGFFVPGLAFASSDTTVTTNEVVNLAPAR